MARSVDLLLEAVHNRLPWLPARVEDYAPIEPSPPGAIVISFAIPEKVGDVQLFASQKYRYETTLLASNRVDKTWCRRIRQAQAAAIEGDFDGVDAAMSGTVAGDVGVVAASMHIEDEVSIGTSLTRALDAFYLTASTSAWVVARGYADASKDPGWDEAWDTDGKHRYPSVTYHPIAPEERDLDNPDTFLASTKTWKVTTPRHLGGTHYDNDDLPYLRAQFLVTEFTRRWEAGPACDGLVQLEPGVLEGKVFREHDPSKRAAEIFVIVR